MSENNNNTEFEVSFNFRNVLYVAQVTMKNGPPGPFYSIVYFSPNEKGEIPVLLPPNEHPGGKSWREPAKGHEQEFIYEMGRQIEKKGSSQ